MFVNVGPAASAKLIVCCPSQVIEKPAMPAEARVC
jgi:hypothetical protein